MAGLIRVLLADDHPVLRAAVRALLDSEPDLEVVAEASTGAQALRLAELTHPDVVVMDLAMPDMDGLEATRRTIALGQGIRVVVLTMQAETEHLMPVLEAGARGFVSKVDDPGRLLEAVRVAHRGDVFLDSHGQTMLLGEYRHADDPEPLDALTEREREVLERTAAGYSAREIGNELFLSSKTIDTYRSRIYKKLGFQHRSDLVQFALDTGLLSLDSDVVADAPR